MRVYIDLEVLVDVAMVIGLNQIFRIRQIVLCWLLHWVLVEVCLTLVRSNCISERIVVLQIRIIVALPEFIKLSFEGVAILFIKDNLHVSSNHTWNWAIVLHVQHISLVVNDWCFSVEVGVLLLYIVENIIQIICLWLHLSTCWPGETHSHSSSTRWLVVDSLLIVHF